MSKYRFDDGVIQTDEQSDGEPILNQAYAPAIIGPDGKWRFDVGNLSSEEIGTILDALNRKKPRGGTEK